MDINQSSCLFCLFFTLLPDISHNLTHKTMTWKKGQTVSSFHFLKDWVMEGDAARVLQPGSVIFFQGI